MKRVIPVIIIVVVAASIGFLYINGYFDERSSPVEPKYDNVDDIITACAEAMGGVDVIDGIQTLKFAQNWPDHGTLHTEIRRPNMERLGETLVWNGTYCAILGSSEEIPEEEWKDNEIDIAWYFPAFFDYPAEYLGVETVNEATCYMVEVTLPLGAVMTYYIDVGTDLVIEVEADFTLYGEAHHAERSYGDYREVDGLLYPHYFTYACRDGVTRLRATLVSLELNLPFEGRFTIP